MPLGFSSETSSQRAYGPKGRLSTRDRPSLRDSALAMPPPKVKNLGLLSNVPPGQGLAPLTLMVQILVLCLTNRWKNRRKQRKERGSLRFLRYLLFKITPVVCDTRKAGGDGT